MDRVEEKPLESGVEREEQLQALLESLAERQGSLERALELLEWLDRRGALEMGTAALERGDVLVKQLIQQANRPGAVEGLKVGSALFQALMQMDSRLIISLSEGMERGWRRVEQGEAPPVEGIWDLLRTLKDPEVAQGLSFILAMLKGIGSALSVAESVKEQQPD
ncbi:DUF1641 domain-containing protein [Salinithrix halophila]|uniref:DUF1641 domain-containing protein n=2 Tax=Salinithrix halophila TaxID=1485204 RepID=A0ABV8JCL9_9BACL